MSLFKSALGEHAKPLAIIIKGNPTYIESPEFQKAADEFYKDVKRRLHQKGYRVQYDAGADMTIPSIKASVWLGHSRGVSRLRYAPKGMITGELKTNSPDGNNLGHYSLSAADIRMIDSLPSVK